MKSNKTAAIVVIIVATFSLATMASVFAGERGKGRHKTKGSALLAKQGRGEYKSKFLHAQGRPFRYLQEKIDELEARLSAYEANAISLQDEIGNVRQDILDIQTQISQIQTEILDIKALQENHDANSEQVEAIEAEIAYLQTELYEKIAELFQKIEQIEDELQGQIVILQAQNIQYGKTIEEGQTAIVQLRDDLSGTIVQLNGLRNDVDANSSFIAQLQIDCLNIQNDINTIQGEINSLYTSINENRLRIDALEQEIESIPAGHTHKVLIADAGTTVNLTSSSDRYWLFLGWVQLGCEYDVIARCGASIHIDQTMVASAEEKGKYQMKMTVSLSHLQLLTEGEHAVELQYFGSSNVVGSPQCGLQKGKVIAIAF
jgi:uncharacterized coiled-coil DUF342 family protein